MLPFGILPTYDVQHLSTPSTAGVMQAVVGPIAANIIRISVLICVVGALLAWNMLATNILYLTAKDGTMPSILTRLNRTGVPVAAALMAALTLQIMMVCSYLSQALYLNMIMMATSLVLIPYLLAALYAMKLIVNEGRLCRYELIKGGLAVLYAFWMIYAGGLKYLAVSSLLYVAGIPLFYLARREAGRRMFDNRFEVALCAAIIAVAVVCGWAWFDGAIRF
jgi:arginine:ornithine antiporter/lysine permease